MGTQGRHGALDHENVAAIVQDITVGRVLASLDVKTPQRTNVVVLAATIATSMVPLSKMVKSSRAKDAHHARYD